MLDDFFDRHPELVQVGLIGGGIAALAIGVWWFFFRKPEPPIPGSRESLTPEDLARGINPADIESGAAIRQEESDRASAKPPETNCYDLHFAYNRAQRLGTPAALAHADEIRAQAAANGCLWAQGL